MTRLADEDSARSDVRMLELQAVRALLLPDADDPRVMSELTQLEALIARRRCQLSSYRATDRAEQPSFPSNPNQRSKPCLRRANP